MDKPDVDSIDGLSPSISIDQKTTTRNPRSTVGTVTEIYDHLRLLFARVGDPYCPEHGMLITAQTVQQIVDRVMALPVGARALIMAPVVKSKRGGHRKLLERVFKEGFVRVRVNGEIYELDKVPSLDKQQQHTIDVIVDRVVVKPGLRGSGYRFSGDSPPLGRWGGSGKCIGWGDAFIQSKFFLSHLWF